MNDIIKEHFSEISLLICHDAKAVPLPLLILMSIVLSTSATSLISLLNKYTFSVLLFHESSNRMSVHLVYALPNLEYFDDKGQEASSAILFGLAPFVCQSKVQFTAQDQPHKRGYFAL